MDGLQSLLAEREIRNLVALYPQCADDGDCERFGGLFAKDGILRIGEETIVGPAAISSWLRGTLSRGTLRHLMMNTHVIVESADHASGTTDMLFMMKGETGWNPLAAPRYTDRFSHGEDGWKFAERVVDPRMARVAAQPA